MTLSRTALECAAWLGYFLENEAEALRYFEGDEFFSLAGRMNSYAMAADAVSDTWHSDAAQLKQRASILGKIHPSQVFAKAKLGNHYGAFYKHFSGTAAHASISSVSRHLVDENDAITTLGPDIGEAEKAYFWAIHVMSIAAATYSSISGTSVSAQQLRILDQHWKRLILKVRDDKFAG